MNQPAHAEVKETTWDAVVVGGGPTGATTAEQLARQGRKVMLLDRGGRIKPCGGAIPPRLVRDFSIPDHLLKARARSARIISPTGRHVDMPIDGGYVGMVDRGEFDEWLRQRAQSAGANRQTGTFEKLSRASDGTAVVHYWTSDGERKTHHQVRTQIVVGADGAKSNVARQCIPGADNLASVFAFHEIIKTPTDPSFDGSRCEVYYQGKISPDFYGWVFPHGEQTSVGAGTAIKGYSIRTALRDLREASGLQDAELIRREGAPIPLQVLKRWDNGRDVVVAGDAAGVVAPASGEGIYYAMESGRMAAEAVAACLATGKAAKLKLARRQFMRAHRRVFWILGIMQRFWYSSDSRRERFVTMCGDPDVQRLTWEAYMNKRLVRARPAAHFRIFVKDMAHLLGLAPSA